MINKNAPCLGYGFDNQDPWHDFKIREMPLKKGLVIGDILYGNNRLALF